VTGYFKDGKKNQRHGDLKEGCGDREGVEEDVYEDGRNKGSFFLVGVAEEEREDKEGGPMVHWMHSREKNAGDEDGEPASLIVRFFSKRGRKGNALPICQ